MNQVIWYDKVVELKVRDIFNTSAVLSFTGAIYGDSRIERVRSILVDLSPCSRISVTEADALTAGAIASAGAR